MKFGPRKTRELAARAVQMQAETGAAWADIARELKVTREWLLWHASKQGRVVGDRRGPTVRVATVANIERAREMRARQVPWKIIGRELGLGSTDTLRRALYLHLRQLASDKEEEQNDRI